VTDINKLIIISFIIIYKTPKLNTHWAVIKRLSCGTTFWLCVTIVSDKIEKNKVGGACSADGGR